MPRRLQSVLALLAGFVMIAVLALGMHLVLGIYALDSETGMPIRPAVPAVGACYTFLFCAFGGYAAACFAPRSPLQHAVVLGVPASGLMLVLTYTFWHELPAWFHFAALAVVLPAAWLGGTLRARQLSPA